MLTSEGLGDAYIEVIRDWHPSEPVRIPVTYHWPIAVTCAALAGALFGAALRLAAMLRGPFQRRRPITVFAIATTEVLLGLILALVYVRVGARFIADAFRYDPIVVALVTATGVIAYRQFVQPLLSVISDSKSR